jgi:hypothetical protein
VVVAQPCRHSNLYFCFQADVAVTPPPPHTHPHTHTQPSLPLSLQLEAPPLSFTPPS